MSLLWISVTPHFRHLSVRKWYWRKRHKCLYHGWKWRNVVELHDSHTFSETTSREHHLYHTVSLMQLRLSHGKSQSIWQKTITWQKVKMSGFCRWLAFPSVFWQNPGRLHKVTSMGFVMEWLLPYNKHNWFSQLYIAFLSEMKHQISCKRFVDFLKMYPSRPLIVIFWFKS